MTDTKLKRWGGAAGLVASGLLAGGLLAGTLSANAATSDSSSTTSSSSASAEQQPSAGSGDPGAVDESKSQRPDEELLTGDTADKVRAAALEEYPNATVLRIETDSDGVYEAHLTTADGERVTVEVDKSFAVTGEEQGGHGGHGGRGGRGGPDATSSDQNGSSSTEQS